MAFCDLILLPVYSFDKTLLGHVTGKEVMSLILANMAVALATKKEIPTGTKFELKFIYFMRFFIYVLETKYEPSSLKQ